MKLLSLPLVAGLVGLGSWLSFGHHGSPQVEHRVERERASAAAAAVDDRIDRATSDLRALAYGVLGGHAEEAALSLEGDFDAVLAFRDDQIALEAAGSNDDARALRHASVRDDGTSNFLVGNARVLVRTHVGSVRVSGLLDLEPSLHAVDDTMRLLSEDGTAGGESDSLLSTGQRASLAEDGEALIEGVDDANTPISQFLVQTRHDLVVVHTASEPTTATASPILWIPIAALSLIILGLVWRPALSREDRSRRPNAVIETVIEFARRSAAVVEPASVLSALSDALSRGAPGPEWTVVSRDAVGRGEVAPTGVEATVLQEVLAGTEAKTSVERDASVTQSLRRPMVVREGRTIFVIHDSRTVYGVAVADRVLDLETHRRAELLFRVAASALRTVDVLERLVISEHQAAVGRLAAGVAHEVNNPLAFVLMNLRALQPNLSGEDAEAVADAIDGCGRIEEVVRGIRVLFHGPDELELAPVDLADLAVKTARIAGARRVGTPIEVVTTGPVGVKGDAIGLGQIMLNLITNAVDAVQERSDPRVAVTVQSDGNLAKIDVQDNGAGVPESVRARLFQAFITTKGKRGTGLGLGIARSFARAHGGELVLASSSNAGSVFRLTLPAEAIETGADVSVRSSLRASSMRELIRPNVLVIDDEAPLLRATRRWLSKAARVTTTTEAREALELTKNEFYALILCDLNMPRMSGLDFVDALRVRDPEAAERVVIMTGSVDADLPGVRVITKPLDPDTIHELLGEASERQRASA